MFVAYKPSKAQFESGSKIAVTQPILHGLTCPFLCINLNVYATCWLHQKFLICEFLKLYLRPIEGIFASSTALAVAEGHQITYKYSCTFTNMLTCCQSSFSKFEASQGLQQ
jgi:hypothetical protein